MTAANREDHRHAGDRGSDQSRKSDQCRHHSMQCMNPFPPPLERSRTGKLDHDETTTDEITDRHTRQGTATPRTDATDRRHRRR
ncbi:hypothetical protein Athai_08780 [Actinocatenispora thailandica]|uniref:Uncharacterized protein n=1 Tax=Actinocatenispora thailandica TaxID=227318 RepID=A0A7R7DKJ5_9ACTN|nr:hypothetical protein Athai_08780 [Actinocatenispora thailandica]